MSFQGSPKQITVSSVPVWLALSSVARSCKHRLQWKAARERRGFCIWRGFPCLPAAWWWNSAAVSARGCKLSPWYRNLPCRAAEPGPGCCGAEGWRYYWLLLPYQLIVCSTVA
jgi:hypothetical protein